MADPGQNRRPAKNERIRTVVFRAIQEGRYRFSVHVLERMAEREVDQIDIKDVLLHGRRELRKDSWNEDAGRWGYSFRGATLDGPVLRVIVSEADPGLLIVTVVELSS